jgi:hypothetical protein
MLQDIVFPAAAAATYAAKESLAAAEYYDLPPVAAEDDIGTDIDEIPINTNASNLFIYGHEWREGVANWLITMSELFIIAKRINATVVLPCIRQGRLMPCAPRYDPPLEGRDWNHRFTDVFQMDLIHDFHPHYMQEEDFQQILMQNPSNREYKFCHIRQAGFAGNMSQPRNKCEQGSFVHGHRNESNLLLEQATLEAYRLSQTPSGAHGPVVVNMTKYDKWGWRTTLFNHKHIVPGGVKYTQKFKYKYFPFQERYSSFIDQLLDEAGIVNHDYVVVQWRAELENMDYLECAKHIVTARDLVKKRNKSGGKGITEDTKFILMSSLNTDESVVWESTVWNTAIKTDAQNALHYLLDEHGFLKIDSLVAKHKEAAKDQIDYSIWDIVLAVEAKDYVFCDIDCKDDSICAQCGHRGQFPRFAMELRNDLNRKSTMCWPEPTWPWQWFTS